MPTRDRPDRAPSHKYLGLDIGTSAIAATLFDRPTQPPQPILWPSDQGVVQRLPAVLPQEQGAIAASGWVLRFKPYLDLALPYLAQTHQPQIQWSDDQAIGLHEIQHALTTLLQTLPSEALPPLAGIVIGSPIAASEAYRFMVREAVLATGWVSQPEQIFFLEEPIAVLLSEFALSERARSLSATLVIDAGASKTDLLLAHLPLDRDRLSRADLHFRSLAYGGSAIDEDILCQLLQTTDRDNPLRDRQPPLPGEPDTLGRDRWRQRLRSSAIGQTLLDVAQQVKLTLQQQDTTTVSVQNQQWTVQRQALNRRVIFPYVQRLNRELNTLLSQTGISAEAIGSVICTGGTVGLAAIAHWLKQKLPNATIVQTEGDRVATGLALLPLYPQMLDVIQHQYSDLFLLRELLKLPVEEPLSLSQIWLRLESQGINTQACNPALLRLLEGLPIGIVPADRALLTADSLAQYAALQAAPLFVQQGSQYKLSAEQRDRLLQQFAAILATSRQTLDDPLVGGLFEVIDATA